MDSKTCYSLYNDSNVQESSIFISMDTQQPIGAEEEESQFLNALDNTEHITEFDSEPETIEQLEYDQNTGEYMFQEPSVKFESNTQDNIRVSYNKFSIDDSNGKGNGDNVNDNVNGYGNGNDNTYGNTYGNTYENYRDSQQFQDIRNDLEDTTNTLRDNIHRVDQRGFKIEYIEEETDKLLDGSNKFRQKSNELRKKMLTKYLLHIFCIATTIIFILVLIIILLKR